MAPKANSWRLLIRAGALEQAALALASVGGAGLSPLAPGTVGTLAAWGAVAGATAWPAWAWAALGIAALVLGTAATHLALVRTGSDDPGWVVIDEAAAYWLGFAALGGGGIGAQAALFVAFRLFDILKPPPARWAERRLPGAWGVMADDLVAAAYAAAVVGGLRAWLA